MDSLFTKLNYKEGQIIYILQQPGSFDKMTETISPADCVRKVVGPKDEVEFVLVFIALRSNLEEIARRVVPNLKGDAVFWLAYPKGTSKKYRCDFNRDSSWRILSPFDLSPVRQVSIDEDWSALRFRKSEYVKGGYR